MSAQIDTSNLAKIGNMTSGGGLAAIMDGSSGTVGYAESTLGYAGVTLAAPTRIDHAKLTSADNGFDASGLTTGITLYLYGKAGTAPSHAHDGQLLGQMSFTDQT